MDILKDIKFDVNGLVPTIVQEYNTKKVLMLAYMNEESILKTIDTGYTWFYSRSRKKLWNKGESSGNLQKVVNFKYDCDGDSLHVEVIQSGVACHTGEYSCFYNDLMNSVKKDFSFQMLYDLIISRKDNKVEGSYTSYLFTKGIDKILKKIGEESAEVIIGAKNLDNNELIYEISDLIYHTLVLMAEKDIEINDIKNELASRYYKINNSEV